MPPSAPTPPGAPRLKDIPPAVVASGAFSILAGAFLFGLGALAALPGFFFLGLGILLLAAPVAVGALALATAGQRILRGDNRARWLAVVVHGAFAAANAWGWIFTSLVESVEVPRWLPSLGIPLQVTHAAAALLLLLPASSRFFERHARPPHAV